MDGTAFRAPYPHISVVVATRNRPDDARRCLHSLAAVAYPCWRVLLIDQSDDTATRTLAARFASILPLTYRHMRRKGQSYALNVALRAIDGGIVAVLDDDCTVAADWLMQVAAAFARHPRSPLVFGSVVAAPGRCGGYTTCHVVTREHLLRGRLAVLRSGMAAGMYLRRAVVDQVGAFDVYMGAGAPFAANDRDFTYRVLSAGYDVVETPDIVVTHHNVRDYQSGAALRLLCRYTFSKGALCMKMLRCGDPAALPLMAVIAWRCLARVNWRNLVTARRPTYLIWIAMYLRGLRASYRLDVDRRRRLYYYRPGITPE